MCESQLTSVMRMTRAGSSLSTSIGWPSGAPYGTLADGPPRFPTANFDVDNNSCPAGIRQMTVVGPSALLRPPLEWLMADACHMSASLAFFSCLPHMGKY